MITNFKVFAAVWMKYQFFWGLTLGHREGLRILEDETTTLPRNVGSLIPSNAVSHTTGTDTSLLFI
jgi:hypothetical protein